jgi:murein L,D-transpeptidase YcbB/YkuD
LGATRNILFILIGFICSVLATLSAAAELAPESFESHLRQRIAQNQANQLFACQGELICGIAELPRFYSNRSYQPAWVNTTGPLPRLNDLISGIRHSEHEGLQPEDYHLTTIQTLLQEIQQASELQQPLDMQTLVDLELLCTDGFLLLASHLAAGRVNPETIHTKWIVNNPKAQLAALLQKAIETDRIEASLRMLIPPHAGYQALGDALARYRRLAKSFSGSPIPPGSKLRKGNRDHRVQQIRERLDALGDLESDHMGEPDLFGEELEAAILRFQKRHGMKADGVVGKRTRAALNVPLEERIRQIELNMERWRWIPHELGERYLLVNIADYKLTIVENHQKVMDMKVVVGRNYRHTPVFSDVMQYLVINPSWNVPTSIAVKDLLPRIKKDETYLRKMNFKVFASWDENAAELDAASIDWSEITPDSFGFRLRQEAGSANALGRIKFIFPNRFAVYLHDTPSKNMFKQTRRGFSSGCIRLEKPIDLAAYLLQGQAGWTKASISAAIDSRDRKVLPLKAKVGIHLLYWTAWVDTSGTLHFRDDIYERDLPLAAALKERPPRRIKKVNWGNMS